MDPKLRDALEKRRRLTGAVGYHSRLDGDPFKLADAKRRLAEVNAEIDSLVAASGASR